MNDDDDDALLREIAAAPAVAIPQDLARFVLLEPGTIVDGNFRIESRLGAGGMGVVYAAHDLKLDREIALKLLRVDRGPAQFGEKLPEVFEREAKATARLNHPNIVTLHQFGSWNGLLYLVLERLRGETLSTRIERGPMTLDESLAIMEAVAKALVHTHAAGITHRDLKPQNVFLVGDGVVKVLDFGVSGLGRMSEHPPAPRGSPGWSTLALAGTPGYMAPEQWDGLAQDPRADLFSFGVMMYQLLVGDLPFGITPITVGAVAPSVEDRVPPVAADLAVLVRELLATAREERIADASSVLDRIVAIRAALRVSAPPRAGIWRASSGLWTIIALVVVAGSVVGALAWPRNASGPTCRASDALAGVWDEAAIAKVSAKFAGSQAWDELRRTIDTYVKQWTAQRDAACRAKDRDAMSCLDARLQNVRDMLRDADPVHPEAVLNRAHTLPPLADCADPQYFASLADAAKPAKRDANALVPYALAISGSGRDMVHGVAFVDDDLAIVGHGSAGAKLSGTELLPADSKLDRIGFIARVSREGVVRWVRILDKATSIGVVSIGELVVVSGFYNPGATLDGKPLEPVTKTYEGMILALDAKTGEVRWRNTLGATNTRSLARDDEGNIYVAGDYSEIEFDDKAIDGEAVEGTPFVASWTHDGMPRWITAAKGTANSKTVSVAVAGNAVVFGSYVSGKGMMGDFEIGVESCVIAKLDRVTGEMQWVHHEKGEGRCQVDYVAVDKHQVAAVGRRITANGGWVATFSLEDGHRIWTRPLGGEESDRPHWIAMANDGSVLAAGTQVHSSLEIGDRQIASNGGIDGYLARFDANGNTTTALAIGGAGDDQARFVGVDPAGHVWVGGRFQHSLRFGGRTLLGAGFVDAYLFELSPAMLDRK